MSVKDVIKSSILENFTGETGLDYKQIGLIVLVAALIGIYIFVVYKNFSKSAFYSKDLNITIAGMTVAVAAIMIALQTSLIVSLGMVGALSIVRFRTAIKNPLDLLYLFWAISGGIICGVRLYVLAILLCVIMTVLIWVLSKVKNAKSPVLVIIRAEEETSIKEITKKINEHCKYSHQCSLFVKNKEIETIFEVKASDLGNLVKELSMIKGVKSVNGIEHDGEIRV